LSRGWLIVFAKAPRPGLVKTRMSPPLTLEQCAALYREVLADVLAATARFAAHLDLEPVALCHPADGIEEIIGLSPPGFRFHGQHGAGLGARMGHGAGEAFAAGADRVLIRGSDSPALGLARLEEAMSALDQAHDVVLTPDQGGGYALIGLSRPAPRLFQVPMSTEGVLEQTLQIAKDLGFAASTTKAAFDLDTVGDLQLFKALSAEEVADLCPRTVQYLSTTPGMRVL
jgi:rSAM/selenodomain-associated transferase 1